jgi:3-hydroxybutyryl-CoA dehydrogenase
MLGWHFFYPANVVPVVEVIAGADSSDASMDRLVRLSRRCRLVPIVVRKDVPGFVINRLQHALTREAYALVENGVVSMEDIDRATRFGFGFRYVAAGPFLQRDHGGLDVHLAAAAETFPTLVNNPAPPAILRTRVAAGKIGLRSNEGFYRWTDETATAERARYAALLQRTLGLLSGELEQEYAAKPTLT